ncbi:MAG TPA: hypothetical protein VFB35_04745 [Gaiellaceae bacterium]|nr:hypothetical protein [Gaiellaceae bacterium]
MHPQHRRFMHAGARRPALAVAAAAAAALALAGVGSASSAACGFCGKNLILNPGAEAGRGLTAVGALGNVPHWTNVSGQFGAAAYTGFGVGWFNANSKGSKTRGKNYFFGGTTPEATRAKATVGTQTIKLPAAAARHKVTLSGWLGNYGTNTASVRAQFTDAAGKTLAALRIGPDSTIAGQDMAFRTRSGTVPAGTASVLITVTFTDHANYSLAGADDLSLVLS